MPAYQVRWDTEINGTTPEDAASQAVSDMQIRTGKVTLHTRKAGDDDAAWKPVTVTVPETGD